MTDHDETQVSAQEGAHASSHKTTRTSGGSGWLFFGAGLVVAVVAGWLIWPPLLYSKKIQPFQFSHAAHTEKAGMDCQECHAFREDGSFSGIPKADECLMCHSWSDRQNESNEAETAFLEEFVTEDGDLKKPLDWLSYSRQPDCVYFSHIAHVEMGTLSCEECHGDHGQTAELRPLYENRITKYPRDVFEKMKMTDCSACHTKYGKPENNACFVCHK